MDNMLKRTSEIRSSLAGKMNSVSLLGDAKYFDEDSVRTKELKKLLDSNFEKEKLEAMKILVAHLTLGRDVSSYFPDVVKNVVVESTEVKKLVYMYVIHYATQNPELALLSINSFQKDMTSSNERVRANALKAMSSIRISVVVPLVVLALKTAVKDNSPYVRKAAAHAIPKVFSLDPKQINAITEMITTLLADREVMVLSGAIYAYSQVCPTQHELISAHFRKFCHLLADMDEWGQVVALNIFLRYGRRHFLSPFEKDRKGGAKKDDPNKPFYSDDEGESKQSEEEDADVDESYEMDPDHRLLLRSASNLLHNMNPGVVMAVNTLYWYLAPKHEAQNCGKFLIQFLRSNSETRYCLLSNIATMAAQRPEMFSPFVKAFYVTSKDPYHCRELKLDILTHLASRASIDMILKEFKDYTRDPDKRFVTATIEAIGRCATQVPSTSDQCLLGLMSLASTPNQDVVASSIVVIRRLLQSNPHKAIIKSMAKMLETTKAPTARASIVWIIGEYQDRIPTYAPDALRILAKDFRSESDEVKVQILNLSVKLFLANPKQAQLLFKYILDLCKYDMNYDIRDRARLVRHVFLTKKRNKDGTKRVETEESAALRTKMQQIFLTEKPTPIVRSPFYDRSRFVLGTLSHMVTHSAGESYEALPDFPSRGNIPDPSIRDPNENESAARPLSSIYSSIDESSSSEGGSSSESSSGSDSEDSDSDSDSRSGSGSESESGSDSYSGSDSQEPTSSGAQSDSEEKSHEEEFQVLAEVPRKPAAKPKRQNRESQSENSSDRSSSHSESFSETGSSSEEDFFAPSTPKVRRKRRRRRNKAKETELDTPPKSDVEPSTPEEKDDENLIDDELLGIATTAVAIDDLPPLETVYENELPDLEFAPKRNTGSAVDLLDSFAGITFDANPALVSSRSLGNGFDVRSAGSTGAENSEMDSSVDVPRYSRTRELLNHTKSKGLQVDYRFLRISSIYGPEKNAIDLTLSNKWNSSLSHIKMIPSSQAVQPFDTIKELDVGDSAAAKIHVDFEGRSEGINFKLRSNLGTFPVDLQCPEGELLRSYAMGHSSFTKEQSKMLGLNENTVTLKVKSSMNPSQVVLDAMNVAALKPTESKEVDDETGKPAKVLRFCGQTLKGNNNVLIQLTLESPESIICTVNCMDWMLCGRVVAFIKNEFS